MSEWIQFSERLCPICDSEQHVPLFTDINRREGLPVSATLVRCRHCGMLYINPAPDAASLTSLYMSGFVDPVGMDSTDVKPVANIRPRKTLKRKLAYFANDCLRGHFHDWPDEDGRGRSILDFGCHAGAKLTHWYQRGWQVAGIDLNGQAIQVAKRRFSGGRFWSGDLPDLEIEDKFDFIRADNVIEHLLEPVIYLQALAKLLKPGGQLRIFVPNGASLSARLFCRYSAVYWMPFHLNLFTPITLQRLFRRAGLKMVSCATYSPICSWTWTLRQLLLRPGFNRCAPSPLDRLIQLLRMSNYPVETIAQWFGMGEESIGTGQRPF